MSCLQAYVSGVGGVQRCVWECWGDTWKSRHAYSGEREELVVSLGLDNEEGSWPTLYNLVESWTRFLDELETR